MIRYLIPLSLLVLLSACSFKSAPNIWQKKSTTAFNSYQKDFLSQRELLAKSDIRRAVEHAKMSANLTQLAKVYLGECALNISVGLNAGCKEYKEVESFVDSRELNAYYHFITASYTQEHIEFLPKRYRAFATYLLEGRIIEANREVFMFERAISSLLSAKLLDNKLTTKSRKKVLDLVSLHGYKKAAIFWLKELKKYTKDEVELENISKRISILTQ